MLYPALAYKSYPHVDRPLVDIYSYQKSYSRNHYWYTNLLDYKQS